MLSKLKATSAKRPRFRWKIATNRVAAAAILVAMVIAPGCDSETFAPPPNPELSEPVKPGFTANYERAAATAAPASSIPPAGKAARQGPRFVEMILARPPDGDRVYLEQLLRSELGNARIPLRLTQPDSHKPRSSSELAAAIKGAVARGAAGLIVEPSEDPEVVDALYQAAGQRIGVVSLDRPVPPRGGMSIPWVEFTGFSEVGRQIVADVLEADRKRAPAARPGALSCSTTFRTTPI